MLPVSKFKWIKDISQFNEDFIKGCFLEVDVQYPENFHGLHNDLPFLLERLKSLLERLD